MSFETELTWSSGWDRGRRKHVRPLLEASAGLATDGLAEERLQGSVPKRTIFVAKSSSIGRYAGDCSSKERVRVHIPERIARHRRILTMEEELCLTLFHEFVHSLRFERSFVSSLADDAAHEGLAYVLEGRFEEKIHGVPSVIILNTPELSVDVYGELLEKLDHDNAGYVYTGYLSDDYFDAWTSKFDDACDLQTIEVLGVNAVARLLNMGATAAELIHMPARELLTSAA